MDSSGRGNLISRGVNRVEIAGRVLGFLVMKIKHLWTWGLGKVTLENMPELARNGVYPVSKNAQELLWLGRGRNSGEGGAGSALLLCTDCKSWDYATGWLCRGLRIPVGFKKLSPCQDLATASHNLEDCACVCCLFTYDTKGIKPEEKFF